MALIAVLALITWVVRWWYQVDDWVPLFGVLATEPAHLPQYLILFALGVAAYRGDWLRRMPAHLGAIWLGVGLTASATMYALQGVAPHRWDDVVASGALNCHPWFAACGRRGSPSACALGLTVFFQEGGPPA